MLRVHIQKKKTIHSINHLEFHQNPSGQASNCCCFGRSLPTVSSGLKVDFGISTWHGKERIILLQIHQDEELSHMYSGWWFQPI